MASRPQSCDLVEDFARERRHVGGGGQGGAIPLANLGDELVGQVEQVVALIPLFGDRDVETEPLTVPRRKGLAEAKHLGAEIVDVELTRHVVADEGEDAAQGVAVRRVARMPDVQRPGGVDAHELDVHLHALLGGQAAAAVIGALGQHALQSAAVPGGVQEQIEKPGAGDLVPRADAGAGAG